jgi:hypothetical protein
MAIKRCALKKMNIKRRCFAQDKEAFTACGFLPGRILLRLLSACVIFIFVSICFPAPVNAALPPDLFENKSEAGGFKAKIKRDIFYTGEELLNIKEMNLRLQAAALPPQPQIQPVAVQTGQGQPAYQQPSLPQPPPVQVPQQSAQGTGSVEVFNVEGIIKMGNRGCAIINSRIWFVGKPEQGYELLKLHPEAVEIKLPDGSVVKHKLMKTR